MDLASRDGRTALAVALTEALTPGELTALVEALVDATSAPRSA